MSKTLFPFGYIWQILPRSFKWSIYLGVSKKIPNLTGSMSTTLYNIDVQGRQWGESFLLDVGRHYEIYSQIDDKTKFPKIANSILPNLPPILHSRNREYKEASTGVTGLIGEVLMVIFLQKILGIAITDIIHLLPDEKSPDMLINLNPAILARLFNTPVPLKHFSNPSQTTKDRVVRENIFVQNEINNIGYLSKPFPVEIKSRWRDGSNQTQKALSQILAYWSKVPEMSGYGIIGDIEISTETHLHITLLTPPYSQVVSIKNKVIALKTADSLLDVNVSKFNKEIGGMLLGRKFE